MCRTKPLTKLPGNSYNSWNTFDEIEALIESVDDVVARVQRHHSQGDVGQEVRVPIDLIQGEVQGFQGLDPIIALFYIRSGKYSSFNVQ